MTAQRDPVSVWFDRGARDLLERVMSAPRGTWVGTRVADPTLEMQLWLNARGIDPGGPDNPSTPNPRGGLNCRDRWTRAFVRALYYNYRLYTARGAVQADRRLTPNYVDALKVDVGRRLVPRGIIPRGRAIRVVILPGGRAARQAARKLPDDERIFSSADGEKAGRSSYIELRDWQAA